jgi:hypothetical protein
MQLPDDGVLDVLGLGPVERDAYELLVDHPGASLDELGVLWTGADPLQPVLHRLEDLALASTTPGPPVRYSPVAPGLAFEAALSDHDERLDRARRHVGILTAAYKARPAEGDAEAVIEVVTGRRAVEQRVLQLWRGARQRIGCLAKPSDVERIAALGRDVSCRVVYDRTAIDHPGALATVERLIEAGQVARVLPDLPLSLYLADDQLAVVPLHGEPVAAIVIHQSALLVALNALFEGLWQRALPLNGAGTASNGKLAGADQQRLITLLLSGLTDEAIARQLGTSHRTIQRRVAALMADLGAHTRFQVGVQAALTRSRAH